MNACFSWCVLCTFIYPVPLAHSNSTCLYFHIKSTIFVSQGKSASGDLSLFLISICFYRWLPFHYELEPSTVALSSPLSVTGKRVPNKSSPDPYFHTTSRWPRCRSPEGLNATRPGKRVTLGDPKGLQTEHARTERALIYPSTALRNAGPSFLQIYCEEYIFSMPQWEWLKHISMSCCVRRFWSDLSFCVNIQIHYHPREMNNGSYFMSLTALNIMKSLTIIPHPSPWILATDRSPVGNGNVSLIHLFTNKSLPVSSI